MLARGRRADVWLRVVSVLAITAAGGCKLLDTSDPEGVAGRGPLANDPYTSPLSGVIRLSLQHVNGCAIRASGEPVGKGTANIPYPASCGRGRHQLPVSPFGPNPPPLELRTDTDYFLNQVTLIDYLQDVHNDPADTNAVLNWMRTQSRFKSLDWSNVGLVRDEWTPAIENPSPKNFMHRKLFDHAAWMAATDDTFTVEVFEPSGDLMSSVVVARSELLSGSRIAHTQVGWEQENIMPPEFPGDLRVRKPPEPPVGFPPPFEPTTRSMVRIDFVGSTELGKTFKVRSGVAGDGHIRLTWSLMPNDPFYFPVRFVSQEDIPRTCFAAPDYTQPVQCHFGLDPTFLFSKPENGQFYQPGESFQLTLRIKDGEGNLLHHPDYVPSFTEYITNNANGLIYMNMYTSYTLGERDNLSVMSWAGPINEMRPYYELNGASYAQMPSDQLIPGVGNVLSDSWLAAPSIGGALPGAHAMHPPTRWTYTIPQNAKPGTYVAMLKIHRQFLGERFSKTKPHFFQVGQSEKTTYPGRVGNCQMCHRGVLSLDNLRHGLSVDHVEGCKTCHTRDALVFGRRSTINFIHALHDSPKFPLQRNDCTLCHLTRESAVRASYVACEGCHLPPHGNEFFSLMVSDDNLPNQPLSVYGRCARSCHEQTTPTAHILPAQ